MLNKIKCWLGWHSYIKEEVYGLWPIKMPVVPQHVFNAMPDKVKIKVIQKISNPPVTPCVREFVLCQWCRQEANDVN